VQKNDYATRADVRSLKRELKEDIKNLEIRLESKIENVKTEVKELITNSEVKVLGELQKMREEDAAHRYSHMRINEDIEELQKLTGKA
jgi:flagellar motility protein MotE (MotC chaperone)